MFDSFLTNYLKGGAFWKLLEMKKKKMVGIFCWT